MDITINKITDARKIFLDILTMMPLLTNYTYTWQHKRVYLSIQSLPEESNVQKPTFLFETFSQSSYV